MKHSTTVKILGPYESRKGRGWRFCVAERRGGDWFAGKTFADRCDAIEHVQQLKRERRAKVHPDSPSFGRGW